MHTGFLARPTSVSAIWEQLYRSASMSKRSKESQLNSTHHSKRVCYIAKLYVTSSSHNSSISMSVWFFVKLPVFGVGGHVIDIDVLTVINYFDKYWREKNQIANRNLFWSLMEKRQQLATKLGFLQSLNLQHLK